MKQFKTQKNYYPESLPCTVPSPKSVRFGRNLPRADHQPRVERRGEVRAGVHDADAHDQRARHFHHSLLLHLPDSRTPGSRGSRCHHPHPRRAKYAIRANLGVNLKLRI